MHRPIIIIHITIYAAIKIHTAESWPAVLQSLCKGRGKKENTVDVKTQHSIDLAKCTHEFFFFFFFFYVRAYLGINSMKLKQMA